MNKAHTTSSLYKVKSLRIKPTVFTNREWIRRMDADYIRRVKKYLCPYKKKGNSDIY